MSAVFTRRAFLGGAHTLAARENLKRGVGSLLLELAEGEDGMVQHKNPKIQNDILLFLSYISSFVSNYYSLFSSFSILLGTNTGKITTHVGICIAHHCLDQAVAWQVMLHV